MPICPNCSYKLVLLPRLKYKCALCSRLYPKKYIENREFKRWNEKQRETDLHNLNLEKKRVQKSIQERTIFRGFRFLFNEKKNRSKLTVDERRIKELERCDRYREANWKKLSLTSRRWFENNREKRYEFLKTYKLKNKDLYKQKQRLAYWRTKQKALADQYLENSKHKSSTTRFFPFSPTFSLCELL